METFNTLGGTEAQRSQIKHLEAGLRAEGFKRPFLHLFGKRFVNPNGSSVEYKRFIDYQEDMGKRPGSGSERPSHRIYSGLKIDIDSQPGDLSAVRALRCVQQLASESHNDPSLEKYDKPIYAW